VPYAGPSARPEWGAGLSFEEAQRTARVVRPAHQGIVDVLLEGARLAPGLRVLDLACGQGVPALDEARKVDPGGSVVGIDISAASVSLARQFAATERLSNASFQVADAGALPFQPGSFDRVTSRFGPMFFPHLDLAVAESVRVLRPGGRIAWLVWGPAEEQPYFQATALVALKWAGLDRLPTEAAEPFRYATGGQLPASLRRAGLLDVQESRHRIAQPWGTTPERLAEHFWTAPAPPFVGLVGRVPPEDRPTAIAESTERFRRFLRGDEVRLGARVVMTTGTRAR
jgi:SAM-dependent methyltransferase